MKVDQYLWNQTYGWNKTVDNQVGDQAHLVLAFGGSQAVCRPDCYRQLKNLFPQAQIVINSSSGEIIGQEVRDDTIVATAMSFDSTEVGIAQATIGDDDCFDKVGQSLAQQLKRNDLKHVFVISDGLLVNGSELVAGIQSLLSGVSITGGLAGDGDRFEQTLVGVNGPARPSTIVAVGLYGDHLQVGYGSEGGWDVFGPERVITKSSGNILYELDGKSALGLYNKYAAHESGIQPGEALFFPLSIKDPKAGQQIVRTVLGIDETQDSMTFAGDMPQGTTAKLMKANFNRLVDGASDAAQSTLDFHQGPVQLAILVSCVGRKLVLGQHIDDEVEHVKELLGDQAVISGFYSYGEIAPLSNNGYCYLHNQTMTITTFSETG